MAIKIQGQTVVDDSRKGSFQVTNPGSFTTVQRNALSAVAGDQIFNTNTNKLEIYNGSQWEAAGGATTSPPNINNVVLSEDNTSGARFTSKSFTSAITMIDDGAPVSQKGVKGKVTAQFPQFPTTSAVISNTTGGQPTTTVPTYSVLDGASYSTNELGAGTYYESSTNTMKVFYFRRADWSSSYIALNTATLGSLGTNAWTEVNTNVNNIPRKGSDTTTVLFEPEGPDGVFRQMCMAGQNGCMWVNIPESAAGLTSYRTCEDLQYFNGKYYELKQGTLREFTSYANLKSNTSSDSWTINNSQSSYRVGRFRIHGNEIMIICDGNNYYYYGQKFAWPNSGSSFTVNGAEIYPNRYSRDASNVVYSNGNWYTAVDGQLRKYNNNSASWSVIYPDGANGNVQALTASYISGELWVWAPRNSSGEFMWWKSYNGGISWTEGWRNNYHGTNNIAYFNSSSYQRFPAILFDVGGWRMGMSAESSNNNPRLFGYQKLTQTLNFNADIPAQFVVGDPVKIQGETNTSNYGSISTISSNRRQMGIALSPTVAAGDIINATNSTGTATSTLFLIITTNRAVTGTQVSDPGYTQVGPGTSQQITFPATFPSGNVPDVDLPAGATLQVEVQATNSSASDTFSSNILTPS